MISLVEGALVKRTEEQLRDAPLAVRAEELRRRAGGASSRGTYANTKAARIAPEVKRLQAEGLSQSRIAESLGVTRNLIAKSLGDFR